MTSINSLYLFNEIFTNGYRGGALSFIDTLSIVLAISVIVSKNPIVSILFLISLFLGIATHLLVSGLSFIGLSYLLVYVGAVSILFLFILMLINIRVSELLNDTNNTTPLVLIIAFLLIYPIFQILPYNVSTLNSNKINLYSTIDMSSYLNNIIIDRVVKHIHALYSSSEKALYVTSKL